MAQLLAVQRVKVRSKNQFRIFFAAFDSGYLDLPVSRQFLRSYKCGAIKHILFYHVHLQLHFGHSLHIRVCALNCLQCTFTLMRLRILSFAWFSVKWMA